MKCSALRTRRNGMVQEMFPDWLKAFQEEKPYINPCLVDLFARPHSHAAMTNHTTLNLAYQQLRTILADHSRFALASIGDLQPAPAFTTMRKYLDEQQRRYGIDISIATSFLPDSLVLTYHYDVNKAKFPTQAFNLESQQFYQIVTRGVTLELLLGCSIIELDATQPELGCPEAVKIHTAANRGSDTAPEKLRDFLVEHEQITLTMEPERASQWLPIETSLRDYLEVADELDRDAIPDDIDVSTLKVVVRTGDGQILRVLSEHSKTLKAIPAASKFPLTPVKAAAKTDGMNAKLRWMPLSKCGPQWFTSQHHVTEAKILPEMKAVLKALEEANFTSVNTEEFEIHTTKNEIDSRGGGHTSGEKTETSVYLFSVGADGHEDGDASQKMREALQVDGRHVTRKVDGILLWSLHWRLFDFSLSHVEQLALFASDFPPEVEVKNPEGFTTMTQGMITAKVKEPKWMVQFKVRDVGWTSKQITQVRTFPGCFDPKLVEVANDPATLAVATLFGGLAAFEEENQLSKKDEDDDDDLLCSSRVRDARESRLLAKTLLPKAHMNVHEVLQTRKVLRDATNANMCVPRRITISDLDGVLIAVGVHADALLALEKKFGRVLTFVDGMVLDPRAIMLIKFQMVQGWTFIFSTARPYFYRDQLQRTLDTAFEKPMALVCGWSLDPLQNACCKVANAAFLLKCLGVDQISMWEDALATLQMLRATFPVRQLRLYRAKTVTKTGSLTDELKRMLEYFRTHDNGRLFAKAVKVFGEDFGCDLEAHKAELAETGTLHRTKYSRRSLVAMNTVSKNFSSEEVDPLADKHSFPESTIPGDWKHPDEVEKEMYELQLAKALDKGEPPRKAEATAKFNTNLELGKLRKKANRFASETKKVIAARKKKKKHDQDQEEAEKNRATNAVAKATRIATMTSVEQQNYYAKEQERIEHLNVREALYLKTVADRNARMKALYEKNGIVTSKAKRAFQEELRLEADIAVAKKQTVLKRMLDMMDKLHATDDHQPPVLILDEYMSHEEYSALVRATTGKRESAYTAEIRREEQKESENSLETLCHRHYPVNIKTVAKILTLLNRDTHDKRTAIVFRGIPSVGKTLAVTTVMEALEGQARPTMHMSNDHGLLDPETGERRHGTTTPTDIKNGTRFLRDNYESGPVILFDATYPPGTAALRGVEYVLVVTIAATSVEAVLELYYQRRARDFGMPSEMAAHERRVANHPLSFKAHSYLTFAPQGLQMSGIDPRHVLTMQAAHFFGPPFDGANLVHSYVVSTLEMVKASHEEEENKVEQHDAASVSSKKSKGKNIRSAIQNYTPHVTLSLASPNTPMDRITLARFMLLNQNEEAPKISTRLTGYHVSVVNPWKQGQVLAEADFVEFDHIPQHVQVSEMPMFHITREGSQNNGMAIYDLWTRFKANSQTKLLPSTADDDDAMLLAWVAMRRAEFMAFLVDAEAQQTKFKDVTYFHVNGNLREQQARTVAVKLETTACVVGGSYSWTQMKYSMCAHVEYAQRTEFRKRFYSMPEYFSTANVAWGGRKQLL
jgi:hypothetical protein